MSATLPAGEPRIIQPMRGIFPACCAGVASGQKAVAVAPPTSPKNLRRLMDIFPTPEASYRRNTGVDSRRGSTAASADVALPGTYPIGHTFIKIGQAHHTLNFG